MKWLISYDLFKNDNSRRNTRGTRIIDIEPSVWWNSDLWRDGQEYDDWDGCILMMIFEIPDESLLLGAGFELEGLNLE